MKTTNLILILLISIVSFKSITPQMIGYIQEQVYETPYRYTTENVNYFLVRLNTYLIYLHSKMYIKH